MRRIVTAALLAGAIAALGLGATNVAGSHYETCPPTGPARIDAQDGAVTADCAVYGSAGGPAPDLGCDGPTMAYATYGPAGAEGASAGPDKYYVCVSAGGAAQNPPDPEVGLWKETNGLPGLQTERIGSDAADAYCATEPLACSPTAAAPPTP